MTYILWSSNFASYLEDYLMEKRCTWDNGSLWLKDRPCKIYVGQWPIFHGPLILPFIIVRLKLFLYIKKWHRPGVFVPLRALALVLQMKEIKSLNSFLAQNVLKLTSFHSLEPAREKINTFSHFKSSKYLLQHIFLAKIMKFSDFSLTFLVFKISLTNLQNSLTFPWPWRKIKFPWLFPDQWPPCFSCI